MRLFSSLLVAVLVGAVTLTAAPPAYAADYRGAVSITFPTVDSARYSDDYANPRSGGRVHRSTDLFAPAGSRIVAARAGRVVWAPALEQAGAGFALQIRGTDGRTYAYYHLGPAGGRLRDAVASGITLGTDVRRGQLIGWLGDSGNAAGGSPHLHFEIHDDAVTDPYGTNRRNPYASLRAAQGLSTDSPVSPPAADDGVLRLGDRGPAVAEWQRQLNRTRPENPLGVDGVFGARTEHATRLFQRAMGLGPAGLGVVGDQTRAALERFLRQEPAPASRQPTTTTNRKPVLRLGDRGPAVTQWQTRLNRTRPHNPLGTDGVFGPRTEHATVLFQRSVGMGPAGLGVVGPRTRRAVTRFLRNNRPGAGPSDPVGPAATAEPVLRLGDRGPAVAEYQRALNRTRRDNPIGTDGVFGPRTERATVLFQRSVGLGPAGLGIVGPKTRTALARWKP